MILQRLTSPTYPSCRAWLAVELLCHCEERGMQQEAVVLCAYLASRAQQPTDIPSASKDPLVEVILKRYAAGCKVAFRGQMWLVESRC